MHNRLVLQNAKLKWLKMLFLPLTITSTPARIGDCQVVMYLNLSYVSMMPNWGKQVQKKIQIRSIYQSLRACWSQTHLLLVHKTWRMPVPVFCILFPPGINIVIPGNWEQSWTLWSCCAWGLYLFVNLLPINTADLLLNAGDAACKCSKQIKNINLLYIILSFSYKDHTGAFACFAH